MRKYGALIAFYRILKAANNSLVKATDLILTAHMKINWVVTWINKACKSEFKIPKLFTHIVYMLLYICNLVQRKGLNAIWKRKFCSWLAERMSNICGSRMSPRFFFYCVKSFLEKIVFLQLQIIYACLHLALYKNMHVYMYIFIYFTYDGLLGMIINSHKYFGTNEECG